ncbi:MAG: hypothetical protein KF696_02835 [Planctomycetes bacterium]|nr:hypothetical protein [Planctomycetota bacterium]MCW8134940.1 hypothetical protein [Planctomycetota bacterium]
MAEPKPTAKTPPREDKHDSRRDAAQAAQRAFAPSLNAIAWALMQKQGRTPQDNEKMLYAAFASAFHYLEVGDVEHHQRAEWLISRVYSVLGNGREAVRHAKRCLQLSEQHADEIEDFDQAFAYEAMARAHAVEGDSQQSEKYFRLAIEHGRAIKDEKNRKVFEAEFKAGDWHGLASGVFSVER